MGKALYWLSDVEWARIEPPMPRSRKGAHRVEMLILSSGECSDRLVGERYEALSVEQSGIIKARVQLLKCVFGAACGNRQRRDVTLKRTKTLYERHARLRRYRDLRWRYAKTSYGSATAIAKNLGWLHPLGWARKCTRRGDTVAATVIARCGASALEMFWGGCPNRGLLIR